MISLLGLLVISCLAIAAYGSRAQWCLKRCAACRRFTVARARKCEHCLEWFPLLLLLVAMPAQAQDLVLIPCPAINFFGTACEEGPAPVPGNLPVQPPSPLFSKDTMAADTPPLIVELLNAPTPEAAQRFLDWQQRRFRAMALAEHLLQQETLARRQRAAQ